MRKPFANIVYVALVAVLVIWACDKADAKGLQGDANCDSMTTSVDALLVLQYEAGMTEEPKCGAEADLNRDAVIDSTDAQGILSLVAFGIEGLFEDNRPRV